MKKLLTAIGITTLGFLMIAAPANAASETEEPTAAEKIVATSYVDGAKILDGEKVQEQITSVLTESGNQVLVYTSPTLDLTVAAEASGIEGADMESQAPAFFKSGVDAIVYVSVDPRQSNVYLKPEFKVDNSELTLIKTTLQNRVAESEYTPAVQETIDSLGFVLLDQVDQSVLDEISSDSSSSDTIMFIMFGILALVFMFALVSLSI
jgi:uncharacterized membrane protein YgcG